MTPSRYQQAIYDFQADSSDNAMICAVAGSGKTTTLVEAANRLPGHVRPRSLFVAFNKHIADELGARLPSGVSASTIHALGARTLRTALRPDRAEWVDKNKYRKLIRSYWRSRGINTYQNPEYEDVTGEVVRLAMLTLTDPADASALGKLYDHFGILFDFEESAVQESAVAVIKAGVDKCDETISFDDMVYLPHALECAVPQYEMIYIDEAQDLNAAQREFVLLMGGRTFFVGDERQSIYGFAGADADSFRTIGRKTGATQLPLTVCYRCPRSHVAQAKEIVPEIEACESAIEGHIEYINRDDLYADKSCHVREGDLILCRMTAPLIELAFDLIRHGYPAKVRGREIGQALAKLVDSIAKDPTVSFQTFGAAIGRWEMGQVAALRQKEDTELQIEGVEDRARTLHAIYAHALSRGVGHIEGLRAYIETLFSDERGAVMLSTVHKAKGLEADRVYILDQHLMPHPRAQRDWEPRQEMNLRYVALTRAKKELYFVDR